MPKRRIGCLVALLLLALAALFGWREYQRLVRERPERFPWTPLALTDPIGPFTGRKLAALRDDPRRCVALLAAAVLEDRPLPPRRSSEPACTVSDGVALRPESERSIGFVPRGLVTGCAVAAALDLWERERVQPLARRLFGQPVVRIDHAGSFSCRRLYGRAEGEWSEHASANAVDILGFRFADGRRISVLGDWTDGGREGEFLRGVRDGGCALFATVLSPDYNRAHADHLHFDQAARGAGGWRGCR